MSLLLTFLGETFTDFPWFQSNNLKIVLKMATKNEYGRYIISAGEVGSYVVCPEAWRLSKIEQVDIQTNRLMKAGTELHNEWGKEVEQVVYFSRTIKTTIALLVLSVAFYITRNIILMINGL